MSCFMIIFVFTSMLVRAGGQVTCDATEVKRGSPSNITCHFGADISQRKLPIGIDRYHGDTPTVVLRCDWSNETEVPNCIHTEGYNFNSMVTNNLTLHVLSTTKDFVGRYVCQVLTSQQNTEACNLNLKENVNNTTVTCDATEVNRGSPSDITCHFGADISQTKQPIGIDRYHGDTPTIVLRCDWSNETEVPNCIHTEGYNFNSMVTNNLTLHVLSTTEEYAGRYACQVLTHEKIQPCNLRLKPAVNETLEAKGSGLKLPLIIAGTVTAVVLSVAIAVVVLWKKHFCENIENGRASQETAERQNGNDEMPMEDFDQQDGDNTVRASMLPFEETNSRFCSRFFPR